MDEPPLDTVLLQDCVARWRAGDRAAADRLLRAAGDCLESLARKMLRGFPNVRGHADTPDVLQGSLLRLLHTLRQLEPASTRDFLNLAAVHVRRELLDLARRYARRTAAALSEEQARQVPASEEGAGADELELWRRFHEAVEALPADEREVVGLRFYHGWGNDQIAELFGVNERTVRRRWTAACGGLHQALGGQFPAALG